MVSNHFSFVAGDGKRTKFWKDSWYMMSLKVISS